MTKTAILNRFDTITKMKADLLNRAHALPPSQLTKKTSPDAWSVLQVIEHMVLAEYHVFQNLPDVNNIKAGKRTFSGLLLYYMVLFILRYRVPVSVPSRDMVPSGNHSLAELTAMWDKSHTWLHTYLSNLTKESIKLAIFTHPASGPMTPKQMILMMEAHTRRHVDQIDALLKV